MNERESLEKKHFFISKWNSNDLEFLRVVCLTFQHSISMLYIEYQEERDCRWLEINANIIGTIGLF